MEIIELVLLIIAYTVIIITIFIEIICYFRNLERIETIAFSIALLLLIISLTVSPFFEKISPPDTTNVFLLLAMILVGLTTPLNIMVEREHKIPGYWRKGLYFTALLLFLTTSLGYGFNFLHLVQYLVICFLGVSVVGSMLLVRFTKPKKNIAHREKIERTFAIAFLILVPVSLVFNYALTDEAYTSKIGFTLPIVFILLSGSKLLDDLQRLSLLNKRLEPLEQHFINYAISNREREIAILLTRGRTYKQISEELHIALPTVKTHASNIYKKCKVKNRAELTALLIN
jgi:DNA-binding CsgD family transcriptional regulator